MKSPVKVGVLNFYYSNNNYGAVLQAYALQEYLNNEGYEAKTINFRNFSRWPHKAALSYLQMKILSNPFKRFRQNYLNLTPNYFWASQLSMANDNFDAFIVGSDQVWRTFGTATATMPHTAFYLSFVPINKKRIAYAPSFGVDYWDVEGNEPYTALVKKEIKKFDAVSVRETSGITICNEIFDVKAKQVLDPTLLVGRDYFDKIIETTNEKPRGGIIYYKLDQDDDFSRSIEFLSRETDFKPTDIYYKSVTKFFGKSIISYREVNDWLLQLRDADLVVTDSFHGICFCILFEKQFVYYPNKERGMARLESLLGLLGLKDRIYTSLQDIQTRDDWREPIVYEKIKEILHEEREKSVHFLKNALA